MKKLFIATGICLFSTVGLIGQDQDIDPVAVQILDRMSDVIGELTSCSFKVATEVDEENFPYGLVKEFDYHEVHFVGPDKMLVNSRGHNGHRGYWYNGVTLTYYSYTENNYGVIDAPSEIISTIDSVNEVYDIEFPAADFFYPTFTDDILENFDQVQYLGSRWLEGTICFHILAESEDTTLQIWIADDALNLPVKMVMLYKNQQPATQYQATFKDWKINPDLPLSIFNFAPPHQANQVTMVPKQ
jgi:hypothetical protein